MSGAQVLEFGTGPDFGNLGFPDLEKLIKLINPLMKAERYSADEQTILRRLRQRAYDRKRNPKFLIPKPDPNLKLQISKSFEPAPNLDAQISQFKQLSNLKIQNSESSNLQPKDLPNLATKAGSITKEINVNIASVLPTQKAQGFTQGAQRALSNIDGEHFVKMVQKILMWLAAAALVSFFLWQQSLALYEAVGFTNSFYAATGGILMIAGFAAYHSITRSRLALFFCLYAGAYEGF